MPVTQEFIESLMKQICVNFRSCLVTTSATHSHVGKHQEDRACNTVYMTLLNKEKIQSLNGQNKKRQSEQLPARIAFGAPE